ncbi:carboxylesterase family protein [Thalassoroseus pseudoceratinae]|uniref:carboxylesterase family protein n=1 Tax=Thalassoroseus pseudoceratinae TaxID=2713176 RepID=UPI001422F3CA|nr:prolyl oligopeptidase family serine peptidase [Thalassoroseus pseudoceratinae]
MKYALFALVLGCTFIGTTMSEAAEADNVGIQKPAKLEAKVPVELDYLLYLPKDYEKQDSWPLLLFLHGAGERGSNLDLVKVHGPPKMIANGHEFPFIVASPQCPKGKRWVPTPLMALIADLESRYKVDSDRIYVTGLSMGGFGTWSLASYAPDRFAAIAPICGGGERWAARNMTKLPIWAFHGTADRAVPVERSEQMIEALKKVGGSPKLTLYPDVGHDSWTRTYENPKLYEWLLQHKRQK